MKAVPVPRNALVLKELRTRMRSFRSTLIIMIYMAVLAAIAIAFLIQQQGPINSSSSDIGVRLFQALSVFQLFLILFITPATTAGAISGERQRQTWDLLLVTRLSRFGIVWGKLITGVGYSILLLFASLPLFSLVFLFGGVEPADIIDTYLVFLCTILLLGTASLFVSALTKRLAVSMIVSNVLALALGVGLSLLTAYLYSTAQATNTVSRGFGLSQGPPTDPNLTPLAQIDPLIALLSALPTGSGSTVLGDLGDIHYGLFFPKTIHLWQSYVFLSLVLTALLLVATTLLVRYPPAWLSRENG